MTFPTIDASTLQRIDRAAALATVDAHLGAADEWKSPLIRYRFSSNFHSDFKEEIGHWLHTAERFGFQGALVERLAKRAKRESRSVAVDPNDRRHTELLVELAAAIFAHYLCGTGWGNLSQAAMWT